MFLVERAPAERVPEDSCRMKCLPPRTGGSRAAATAARRAAATPRRGPPRVTPSSEGLSLVRGFDSVGCLIPSGGTLRSRGNLEDPPT